MNKSRVLSLLPVMSACAVVLLAASVAQACPGCKAALAANSEGGANLVRGYFYSILFMMGMPFTILGAFSFSVYRAVKKAQTVTDGTVTDRTVSDETASDAGDDRIIGGR